MPNSLSAPRPPNRTAQSTQCSLTALTLTSSFPRNAGDYAGSFVLGLANALSSLGVSHTVVAPSDRACAADYQPLSAGSIERFDYFPVRRWQALAYGDGMPANLRHSPLAALQIPGFLRAMRRAGARHAACADIIISHWLLPAGWIGAQLAREFNRPHVCIVHSSDLHLLRALPGGRALFHRIERHCDALIGISRYTCDELLELCAPVRRNALRDKLHALPLGVDHDAFTPARRTRMRTDGPLHALFLGRLTAEKGLAVLLEALRDVDDVRLTVAGDGRLRGTLEKQARSLGLDARFLGTVNDEQKLAALAEADCLALPSVILPGGRQEGMPVVLLEALACSLPVIAARVGGVAEAVTHEQNGLLVEPGLSEPLRRAIVRLRDEGELLNALSQRAGALAPQRDWRVLAPRFAQLFESCLRAR